jgi:hypothetical protein
LQRHEGNAAGRITMNDKVRSEEHYAELAEHRIRGNADEANAEGTIYPSGEPVERTGRYADVPNLEENAAMPPEEEAP